MTQWNIDPAHSEIKFRVKHLVVSTVTGRFDRFAATIQTDNEDFSDARLWFEADVDSINTNNEQRDAHLKSADFFDASSHPKLTFRSKAVRRLSPEELEIVGDLTIRGTTRRTTLRAVYNGTVAGFGGLPVAGFEITGKINRFDFGLHWNTMTEAGGVVVSSDVRIDIAAEFTRVREAAKAA